MNGGALLGMGVAVAFAAFTFFIFGVMDGWHRQSHRHRLMGKAAFAWFWLSEPSPKLFLFTPATQEWVTEGGRKIEQKAWFIRVGRLFVIFYRPDWA